MTFVELSHPIRAGLITYPGLPSPVVTPHLTRSDSCAIYAPGTEFAMDIITMIGNTGTYLDSPYHRFDGGTDLAGLPLDKLVRLAAIVVSVPRQLAIGPDLLEPLPDVRGAAVLLHTGDSARFGTPQYADDPHFLTRSGAEWLVARGAALVGIDAINIDSTLDGTRPAHTVLLGAEIPVIEHLTGLDQLPATGALFTAVPPLIEQFGTFPVRAFAELPGASRC